ncbi:MAG: hypothetical protein JOZ18_04390, partial [Chloroflexi bacterium]|nr:hypothetical protein [Chloroflexota bacterium]
IEYDPDDHKIFVSDPGLAPSNAPDIDPKNQNLSVINVLTNQVTKINLGHMPKLPTEHAELVKFGYDVGHNHYDPGLRRIFVTSQQLTDQNVTPLPLPPPGTGELISVDPVRQTIVGRVQLPNTCGTPHGMNIDTDQQIAFIACTDVDPANHLVQNLVRVNLRSMQVIPGAFQPLAVKPDIVVIDHSLHVLFVGCNGGISAFDISNGNIRKLGDYNLGKGTHTVAVNEATQEVYLPLVDVGGRPVLRIAKYNQNGI